MKKLEKPIISARDVYIACVDSVSDPALAARFRSAQTRLLIRATQFTQRAVENNLYMYPASQHGHPEALVYVGLTKSEFVDLYETNMVTMQPGRAYYDQLLLTPNGKCPFCWFGQTTTLDHFLPKARYPYFSVLPENLVPSCHDCNKGKKSKPLSAENQIPHPYFEDSSIETDTWLMCRINETDPMTATFFVSAPEHWPQDRKSRINKYFKDLKLASRFSVEAASEIVSISDYLIQLKTTSEKLTHLTRITYSERLFRKNFWKAALYEALQESKWYQRIGYRISASPTIP